MSVYSDMITLIHLMTIEVDILVGRPENFLGLDHPNSREQLEHYESHKIKHGMRKGNFEFNVVTDPLVDPLKRSRRDEHFQIDDTPKDGY